MRKSPQMNEVLPLYLHGLSTSDFGPAREQFLGSGAGLSAASITRLRDPHQQSGSGDALLRPRPLRSVRATFTAHGSSKPQGRHGLLVPPASLKAASAGGVHKACRVPLRRVISPVVGEVVGSDCLPDHAEPPAFPFIRGIWRLIGREQVVSAEWTAAVLPSEQAGVVAVERWFDLAPPPDPIVTEVGVVWRRPSRDRGVTDDGSPGELDQVGDDLTVVATRVVGIAEHPLVVPELVEPAEVAICNPPLRLAGVAAAGPPPCEPPHVVVQRGESLAGHHAPVVGGPAPDDGVEPGDDRQRVRATHTAHLVGEPTMDSLDRIRIRLDE
ncbi:putative transposase (plasmid) [Rhodococcus opacus B4]|uniref:Putative transposase n=1 Tax=Rhodococcus opacus (strain B4) TaxID=632772 RepID=C1BDP1_RHOOB|nr:putative transposase [Rhodococcus opacus B4]